MKKKLIVLIAVIAIVVTLGMAFVAVSLLPGLFTSIMPQRSAFAVNTSNTEKGLDTAENFRLFSGDNIDFAFQYPSYRSTAWRYGDGAYIYCGEEGEAPYVLINRLEGRGMTPEKYFKDCNKLMLSSFSNVQSTPINEVELEDKTLYLVRYICDGKVIDRYLELYDGFYIEYTSISDEKGSLDTELYYAISTLRVSEGAYIGAYSDDVTWHTHDELGMSIDIPDMLELKDLTIGYFASCDDALMLALWITEDDGGRAIYNRKDFIDRAAESPEFVAGLLGADSASFTEGQENDFDGKSFYCYPMQMLSGEDAFSGELCLANAGETGCWLVCYAVREDCSAYTEIKELFEGCAESIDFE